MGRLPRRHGASCAHGEHVGARPTTHAAAAPGRAARGAGAARRSEDCRARGRALNNAVSIYLTDATLASAFVARWCVTAKVETAGGAFQVREDELEPRPGAGLHRTPERGAEIR